MKRLLPNTIHGYCGSLFATCRVCMLAGQQRAVQQFTVQPWLIAGMLMLLICDSDRRILGMPGAVAADERAATDEKPATASEDFPVVDLLAGELGQTWKCYNSDAAIPLSAVWKVAADGQEKEPVLICTGQPKGFLYTNEVYSDFELTLQWKFPDDANGNSGVLVYTQHEEKIWPTAMQVQFHQPKAGSVFPSGDAKSDNKTDRMELAHPINTWNDCRIVSRAGRLTVEINGVNAGETTGSVPSSGSIALQSEGAIVHFRRLKIRKLQREDPKAPEKPPEKPVAAP